MITFENINSFHKTGHVWRTIPQSPIVFVIASSQNGEQGQKCEASLTNGSQNFERIVKVYMGHQIMRNGIQIIESES